MEWSSPRGAVRIAEAADDEVANSHDVRYPGWIENLMRTRNAERDPSLDIARRSARLRAEFNANAYSGRVEGGYRLVAPGLMGVCFTPYAGVQFTTFDPPGYAERVISGSPAFALAYGAKIVTDTRSELGVRAEQSLTVPNGVLTLRGRHAWARDFNPDRSFAATFQSLPGASFAVHGAN